MTQSFRPHYNPKKDANHYVPLKACQYWGGGFPPTKKSVKVYRGNVQGISVELYDTNQAGGQTLDWLAIIDRVALFIEVKAPRVVVNQKRQTLSDRQYYIKQLKPGELAFFYHSAALKIIATSEEACWYAITSMIDLPEGQPYKSDSDYPGLFPPDFDYKSLINEMELEVEYE